MNDFDKAADNIGNRFALVLVASERVREINRQRRDQEEYSTLDTAARKRLQPAHNIAFAEIENGTIGAEYLVKINDRKTQKRKPRFDEI